MDKIFYGIFDEMPRLGPGSEEATLKALSKVKISSEGASVLDIGCGTGAQTVILGKKIRGTIIALDNYQPFLEQVKKKVEREKILAKIEFLCQDMREFQFENNSFDLIWAEGSIYIIGFNAGLGKAKLLVKFGGYVVFSDMNWLKEDPPTVVVDFFKSEYPEMMAVKENIELIKKQGFKLVHHFPLDKSAHWEPYYKPLEMRLKLFRERYQDNPKILELVDGMQHEVDLYKKYSDYYGYIFYIMKKV